MRKPEKSTFEERLDLVAKLGIKILPSEDLRSRKIQCQLNLLQADGEADGEREHSDFAKVVFGEPGGIRTLDTRIKSPVLFH